MEVAAGRIIGRLPLETEAVHISRFGAIPEPHLPGKWCLITDLSSPPNNSVNNGINPLPWSLSYALIDDAVLHIVRLGSGAMLAKFDIVRPQDRMRLGTVWKGDLYIDGALPFGLRLAPKL